MRTNLLTLIAVCGVLLVNPVASQAAQEKPAAAAAATTINLNTATIAQLETLPGIGRRTAERIVEYRDKNGGFKKVEELMNVKGIGEKSFLKLKALVQAPPKGEKAGGH